MLLVAEFIICVTMGLSNSSQIDLSAKGTQKTFAFSCFIEKSSKILKNMELLN